MSSTGVAATCRLETNNQQLAFGSPCFKTEGCDHTQQAQCGAHEQGVQKLSISIVIFCSLLPEDHIDSATIVTSLHQHAVNTALSGLLGKDAAPPESTAFPAAGQDTWALTQALDACIAPGGELLTLHSLSALTVCLSQQYTEHAGYPHWLHLASFEQNHMYTSLDASKTLDCLTGLLD